MIFRKTWIFILASLGAATRIDEPYGWSCYTLVSRMEWEQCKGVAPNNMKKCLCNIPEFVSISAECLVRAVANDSDPEAAFEKGLAAVCQETLIQSELSRTVHDDHLPPAILTAKSILDNEHRAQFYGAAMLIYWSAVCVLRIAFLALRWAMPSLTMKLRKNSVARSLKTHWTYHATFRGHHAQPLGSWCTFNIPTRWTTLVITGAIALNAILLFVDYNIIEDHLFFSTHSMQFKKILAYRSACTTMFLIPILFVFAGRNNHLIPATQWSLDTFNVFHKWVGRIIFANLVIHASAYSALRAEQGLYPQVFAKFYWRWGAVAIGCVGTILFQSIHAIRRLKYDLFVFMHVVLAVVFLIGAWRHVMTLSYGRQQLLAVFIIWTVDRLFRTIRILLSGKSTARLTHNDVMTVMEIGYSGKWCPRSCSYVFVHFKGWQVWQSHPFTVIPCHDNKIKICARRGKGLTSSLAKLPADKPLAIWLDGPYGVNYTFREYSDTVFIAGGIGITVPISCIYSILRDETKVGNIHLHWSIPTFEYLEFLLDEIETISKWASIHLYVTRPDDCKEHYKLPSTVEVTLGRMEVENVVRDSALAASGPMAVLCCGPGGLNDRARKEVCQALKNPKLPSITYLEESFSF